MQKKHWQSITFICTALIAALVIAGCVQPASDEIAPTDIGSGVTFTPTSPPTVAPAETDTPTASPEVVVVVVSDTPSPSPTLTATATPSPTDANSALLQGDTLTLVPGGDLVTEVVGIGQIRDSQQTATAIIANATATSAAIQTATAIGAFGGFTPTFTPMPTVPGAVQVTPVTVPIVPGADCVHEVRAEDGNLYRLSLAYGVQVVDIAQASGIVNPNLISIGQRLTIPGCGTTGGVPPATSTPGPNANPGAATGGPGTAANPTGDCTWGTSVVFPNGCPSGTGGTGGTVGGDPNASTGTGGPAVGGGRTHRVAQGDTLFGISLQYGVTIDSIMAANGITNPDQIQFNDQLIIP
jgi:LysM repeat protein